MPKTVRRDDLIAYLDRYLRVSAIPDSSPNGLQVQGADRVARVAFAVDASVKTIRAAAKARADILIVHHGLWWGRHEQIVGNMHARVSALIEGGVSLYAAHLPLDCHGEVGNNVELARLLSLTVELFSLSVPSLVMPPPTFQLKLPLTVTLFSVNVPVFKMPAPSR